MQMEWAVNGYKEPEPEPQHNTSIDEKVDDEFDDNSEFDDNNEFMDGIRRGFIIKVYSILVFWSLVTVIMCIAPTVNTDVQDFLIDNDNGWILIVFAFLSSIPLYALACFTKLARKVPINYILLFSFVFWKSIVVAYICASVGDPKLVMIAALMTMGLTSILTAFACYTKIDFTLWWGAAFIMLGTLTMIGFFAIIFQSDVLYIVYFSVGIVVYGFYLLIDTQLICGGHTWKLSEDDYIIGALILYIDIIILFIKILELLRRK
jgi:FtsH-binding integral membrane protein